MCVALTLKNKRTKAVIGFCVLVPPGSRDPLLGSEGAREGGVLSEEERHYKPAHLF